MRKESERKKIIVTTYAFNILKKHLQTLANKRVSETMPGSESVMMG
jgi:hypothetical protein